MLSFIFSIDTFLFDISKDVKGPLQNRLIVTFQYFAFLNSLFVFLHLPITSPQWIIKLICQQSVEIGINYIYGFFFPSKALFRTRTWMMFDIFYLKHINTFQHFLFNFWDAIELNWYINLCIVYGFYFIFLYFMIIFYASPNNILICWS